MAYLNLDPDYFDHPKTRRLIGILGPGAEALPLKLWCHCAKYHAETGLFKDYSAEEIEALVNWSGEKGAMVAAMTKVGFLQKNNDGYEINDWLDHEGHIAKFKKRSKLAAKARWNKILKPSITTSITKGKVKQSPVPNRTVPTLPIQKDKTKFLDFVFLKDEELKKLIDKLGERNTQVWIERLNNYIGSKGKKYHSHYHTILTWHNRTPLPPERVGMVKIDRPVIPEAEREALGKQIHDFVASLTPRKGKA